MASQYATRIAATGLWLYDGAVSRRIDICARPAQYAASRYNDDDEVDESTPIPRTPDGQVYYVGTTAGGEFLTLAQAMAWADAQPWGPVKWNQPAAGNKLG
jgi:hypothetical protein